MIEQNGMKIGFYSATWGLNDPALEKSNEIQLNLLKGLTPYAPDSQADLEEARSILKEMKEAGVDQKILALHWGHEFEKYPTANQMDAARELVAAGADIIMGAHSHVVQPSEILFVNGYEKQLPQAHPVSPEMKLDGLDGPPRKALILYSLGNFTTNMFTTECQQGAIQSVQLFRQPDGQVDWTTPQLSEVFNQRGGLWNQRKLWLTQNPTSGPGV